MTKNLGAINVFNTIGIKSTLYEESQHTNVSLSDDNLISMLEKAYGDLSEKKDIICDNGSGDASLVKLKYLFINDFVYNFIKNDYIIYIDIIATCANLSSTFRELELVGFCLRSFYSRTKNYCLGLDVKDRIKVNIWKNEFFGRNFSFYNRRDKRITELENADGFYNLKEKNMLHAVYTVAQEKTAARLDLIFEAMKYKKLLVDMAKEEMIYPMDRAIYKDLSQSLLDNTYESAVIYDK